jgi:hypothetical protein
MYLPTSINVWKLVQFKILKISTKFQNFRQSSMWLHHWPLVIAPTKCRVVVLDAVQQEGILMGSWRMKIVCEKIFHAHPNEVSTPSHVVEGCRWYCTIETQIHYFHVLSWRSPVKDVENVTWGGISRRLRRHHQKWSSLFHICSDRGKIVWQLGRKIYLDNSWESNGTRQLGMSGWKVILDKEIWCISLYIS